MSLLTNANCRSLRVTGFRFNSVMELNISFIRQVGISVRENVPSLISFLVIFKAVMGLVCRKYIKVV